MFLPTRNFPKIPKLTTRESIPTNISNRNDVAQFPSSDIGVLRFEPQNTLPQDIDIFKTDRISILNFAKDNQIPSKYVFILNDRITSIPKYIISNNNEDFNKLFTFLRQYVQIEPRELLFYLYELEDNTELFFDKAIEINQDYENRDFFQSEYKSWSDNLKLFITEDEENLNNIEKYFDSLGEVDPLQTSDITITKYSIEYDIKQVINKDATLFDVAPDLFSMCKASSQIPYIRFNDGADSRFKLYTGRTFEERPLFKLFESKIYKFKNPNMIYCIILSSSNEDKQVKESYTSVSIDLINEKLSIKYFPESSKSEADLVKIIKNTFPELIFTGKKEKNFSGYFRIYDLSVREDSFLDLLLSSYFSKFLFIDEFENPITERRKLKFYFDTNLGFTEFSRDEQLSRQAKVGAYITQYISGVNDSDVSRGRYDVLNFPENIDTRYKIIGSSEIDIKSEFLPIGTTYIIINISRAKSRLDMYQFANIVTRLLTTYNQVKRKYELEYEKFIPELKDPENIEKLSLILNPEKTLSSDKLGKVSLQVIAPEIFSGDYSRDCQYKDQPILIDESMSDSWKNKKVKNKDTREIVERPVLKLGDYTFVCPTDIAPFISLKQKKIVQNPDYPYYPCCYNKPQTEIRPRNVGTSKRSNDPIKTKKIMGEEGIAYLPIDITEYLKGIFGDDPVYRMGTFFSPSSVISALLHATNNTDYIELDDDEKEEFINTLRKNISNESNFNVVSSELYDMPLNERRLLFQNTDEFLDPSLFYRVLEEAFNVNIFIFSGTKPEPNIEPKYNIDISRYSSIPFHSYDIKRNTVLIFKHWGSETDNLPYQQCELIIFDSERHSLFSTAVGEYLLYGYSLTSQLYGRIYSNFYFDNYSSDVINSILSQGFFDIFKTQNIKAVAQLIDNKGKLRALQINTNEYGYITIATPPLPPQNLPLLKRIEKRSYETVKSIFIDQPVAVSKEDNTVVGLWYELNTLKYGIFIPIKPSTSPELTKIQSGPDSPLEPSIKENITDRLLKLQRDIKIIIQITRWLFNLYRTITTKNDISYFFNKYVKVIQRDTPDSAEIYDFSSLSRLLPFKVKSVEDALRILNKSIPSLIDGRNLKILISGEELHKRIYDSLQFYKDRNLPIILPQYLSEYYITEKDYPHYPGNIIFFNEESVDNWLQRIIKDPTSTYEIQNRLKNSLSDYITPYLYSPENNLLVIIQNAPLQNGLQIALHIANTWNKKKINISPSQIEPHITTGYKIFGISRNETLELLSDKSGNNNNPLFVLFYPESQRYAAILPI